MTYLAKWICRHIVEISRGSKWEAFMTRWDKTILFIHIVGMDLNLMNKSIRDEETSVLLCSVHSDFKLKAYLCRLT
jgi:hypothetical protein